jgi:protein-disulfide isomerase
MTESRLKPFLFAGLGGLVGGGLVLAAVPFVGAGSSDTAVRDYILSHPEILPEAMAVLQNRESVKQIDANRAALERPFAGAWAGAADGDVVLVQFFDYACGYCRSSLPHIEQLLAEDKKLKVVFRELPILSENSEIAARVSLAAAEQGRFMQFHDAMYAAGPPDAAAIAQAQAKSGLDAARVASIAQSPEVRRELETNVGLARALGASGTPTWVVGGQVLNGAVGYDALKRAIDETRATAAAKS